MLAFGLGTLLGCAVAGGVATLVTAHIQRLRDQAVADDADLARRLADCLAKAVDTPLLTLNDPEGFGRRVELRLSSFDAGLAEHAAQLLDEAGR